MRATSIIFRRELATYVRSPVGWIIAAAALLVEGILFQAWGLSKTMLSADVLTIEEGSLYPALQRMLVKGWVLAEWKISANNRRARFYTLTTAGKKQLGVEQSRFSQMFGAIMRVMKTT